MTSAFEIHPESLRLNGVDPRGEGEAVLFVHGFSHNHVVWGDVFERMPARFRPIAIDLRGHGASDWSPSGAYDLTDYASDLGPYLDAQGIRRAHIVGHSLGGNVSTLFAARHARRVASLTLVDTGPALSAAGSNQIFGEVGDSLQSHASVAAFREQLALIHPQGAPSLLDRLAAALLVRRIDGHFEVALDPGVLGQGTDPNGSAGLVGDLSSLEDRLWSALGSVACPALVLRGAVSSVLGESTAERMVNEVLRAGRLETIEAAGHAIMIDAPEALATSLCAFLDRVSVNEVRPAG